MADCAFGSMIVVDRTPESSLLCLLLIGKEISSEKDGETDQRLLLPVSMREGTWYTL